MLSTKVKLKILAWPLSVLLTALLSAVAGVSIGKNLGTADFHNERVRAFQIDVTEAARSQDARTRELLEAAGNLAGTMIDRQRYEENRAIFFAKAKRMESR